MARCVVLGHAVRLTPGPTSRDRFQTDHPHRPELASFPHSGTGERYVAWRRVRVPRVGPRLRRHRRPPRRRPPDLPLVPERIDDPTKTPPVLLGDRGLLSRKRGQSSRCWWRLGLCDRWHACGHSKFSHQTDRHKPRQVATVTPPLQRRHARPRATRSTRRTARASAARLFRTSSYPSRRSDPDLPVSRS